MTRTQHAGRIGLLMAATAALLGWLAGHTDIFFADGLRYIDQAQRLDAGSLADGLLHSVDHPAYPASIVAAHRLLGGETPRDWQIAAQAAAAFAGVLLVVPIYLLSIELFGPRSAWLTCLLVYSVPLTGHVLADALSESTFLLFWTWGLWAALRFLKEGTFGWLPLTIAFGSLAYLTRPEGLLLPAALVASLALMPLLPSTRLNWPRWWAAVGFLVIGPAVIVGPYIAARGGLGTKPAIARLLGTAPRSAPDAVERSRPLDPNQSTVKTYALASKAVFEAVKESVTLPLLLLAPVGLALSWPTGPKGRSWLFLSVIAVASTLALVRLHATGGYCSARHAMILALLLIPCSAAGLDLLMKKVAISGRWLGMEEGRFTAGPAVWLAVLGGFLFFNGRQITAPINAGLAGYRLAAEQIERDAPAGARVVDVTGWSLFYARRPGYTFANLVEATNDPELRWVVVRDAHLRGPWWYCERLRHLVDGLKPVGVFPAHPGPRESQVLVFDRQTKLAQGVGTRSTTDRR